MSYFKREAIWITLIFVAPLLLGLLVVVPIIAIAHLYGISIGN